MDLQKINKRYSGLKVTFFAPIALIVGAFVYRLNGGSEFVANSLFWLSLALNVAFFFFLGSLANLLGKNASLWILFAIFFPGVGAIMAFSSMASAVAMARSSAKGTNVSP